MPKAAIVRSPETSRLPPDGVTARFAGRLPKFIEKVAEYRPDIIIAPGSSGRIVAYFLRRHLGTKAVFFLNRTFRYQGLYKPLEILLSENPLLEKAVAGKRVLVVDDFTRSGMSGALVADYLRPLKPLSIGFMSMTHDRNHREEALSSLSEWYGRDIHLGEEVEGAGDALIAEEPGIVSKDVFTGGTKILRTDNYRVFLKKVEALLEQAQRKKSA